MPSYSTAASPDAFQVSSILCDINHTFARRVHASVRCFFFARQIAVIWRAPQRAPFVIYAPQSTLHIYKYETIARPTHNWFGFLYAHYTQHIGRRVARTSFARVSHNWLHDCACPSLYTHLMRRCVCDV